MGRREKLEDMLEERITKRLSMNGFIEKLPDIVAAAGLLIKSTNKEYERRYESYKNGKGDKFTEGTIRAALYASLRMFLPKSWYVQAECKYPGNYKKKRVADLLVHTPDGDVIAFEIKRNVLTNITRMEDDVKILRKHVMYKRSPVIFGVFAVPVSSAEHLEKLEKRTKVFDSDEIYILPVLLY